MAIFGKFFAKGHRTDEPSVPAGYRAYAIGDIHGRLDLLEDVLSRIEFDIDSRGEAQNILVFLGDLIDRGPHSAQVIERARTYLRPGLRTVFLSGNHEEVLLRLLRGESQFLGDWLRFGGTECAASYEIDPVALKKMRPDRAVAMLRERIPADHQAFLQSFVDTFRIGSYLFVHAGVRPGVPFSEQTQADLRWIREPFLHNDEDHGFIVVHGHTITDEVDVRGNRIGLDTGAYRSGVLTAIALESTKRWFLQTACQVSVSPECAVQSRVALADKIS